MAKKKATKDHCRNCAHDCTYTQEQVPKVKPDHPDTTYCGRIAAHNDSTLTVTALAGEHLWRDIRGWIHTQDWSVFAQLTGRVMEPCPGFEKRSHK